MQWWLVGLGAAVGGMVRLAFSPLNSMPMVIPLGTWLANLLGGILMGVVLGLSDRLSMELRYLLATGFLGGLTTFSTFSAESFMLLQQGRFAWAFSLITMHVLGSIALTGLGWWLTQRIMS